MGPNAIGHHFVPYTGISDMHCFWVYKGCNCRVDCHSAAQHLHLRIFKTDGDTGRVLAEGGGEFGDAKLGDEARQILPRRFEIVLRCVARLSPSRGHGRKSSMDADAISPPSPQP